MVNWSVVFVISFFSLTRLPDAPEVATAETSFGAEREFPVTCTVLPPVSSVLSSAPLLTVNEMLTSVLPRASDLEPSVSNVAADSAAVPEGTVVGVSLLGLLETVTGAQRRLDTSEESHDGEANPPTETKGYSIVFDILILRACIVL